MRWRNGERGYGVVTKTLHWVTFGALLAQFTVGYLMDVDDDGGGHGRGRGRGHGSGHGRGRGGEVDLEDPMLRAHVALGLLILVLAALRPVWRRWGGLPPWAESLSARERTVATVVERVLMVLLFVIPSSGLSVLLGDDDLLPLHVASHVAFFVAFAAHLALVLRHTVVRRNRLLFRML
jgi:cytochrome b561